MFYNINTGEVEDFVGGRADLEGKIARTPRDPVKTYLDDPLRILRAVRFAAKYNLELDPELIKAVHLPEVKEAFKNKISQERIWAEMAGKKDEDKWKPGALIGPNPTRAMKLIKQLGLLEIIFDPTDSEKEDLKLTDPMVDWDTPQNNPYHDFTIWDHTLKVLKHLVELTRSETSDEDRLVRNLAAVLHDIGKRYKGIQDSSKGHTSYHGHEEMSGKIAEKVLSRLGAPKKIIERVKKLIDIHIRPHMLTDQSSTDSAIRRFIRDNPADDSVDLGEADHLGKKDYSEEQILAEREKYEALRTRIKSLTTPKGKKLITGKDLIDIGVPQGPLMGQIMRAIDELLLENPNLTREEALDVAKEMASQQY